MRRWAAIFDWDGVILDSSRQHEQAWQRLAQEESRPTPPGFFPKSFGMKNDKVIRELLAWTDDPTEIARLSDRKEMWFRQIIREDQVAPLPGVVAWLQVLQAAQVPCAIASSTTLENIECVIDRLGIRSFFSAVVSAEDVTRGKPNPEVFLVAARRLQTPPNQCVVFEDAHVGIEAGLAAGMRVVAVATTHPRESLHRAHRVVEQLDELGLSDVEAWFAADDTGSGEHRPPTSR